MVLDLEFFPIQNGMFEGQFFSFSTTHADLCAQLYKLEAAYSELGDHPES